MNRTLNKICLKHVEQNGGGSGSSNVTTHETWSRPRMNKAFSLLLLIFTLLLWCGILFDSLSRQNTINEFLKKILKFCGLCHKQHVSRGHSPQCSLELRTNQHNSSFTTAQYRVKNGINIIAGLDQLVRGARPAYGGPWPSVNLLTHLPTQGVNSSLYICTTLIGKS